jgi:hypothetical protein
MFSNNHRVQQTAQMLLDCRGRGRIELQPEQMLYKAIGQGVGARKCLFRRVVATKGFDV